jgi:glycosyltransferase involved in cell wall biosynthesis
MKIAFIHDDKKITTGAGYINDLISQKLKERGVTVKHFYPKVRLLESSIRLRGLQNILFFHSLLEDRNQILKCDLIQGTTYTPITFLSYDLPVISHFGSTGYGFLRDTPSYKKTGEDGKAWVLEAKEAGVLRELDIKTRRPQRDIADIEQYVARHADHVVATSQKVREELRKQDVPDERITVIHNAIEDYWFTQTPLATTSEVPTLVFLGRIGDDPFTFLLKGIDRLFGLYDKFPKLPKRTLGITLNKNLATYMNARFTLHEAQLNVAKHDLPAMIRPHWGDILLITSRYEGFSLSLIEGMSQGLVPIVFKVGVAPEIIRDGENGFLVETVKEAKQRIEQLATDRDLRHSMANEAWKTAQDFKADEMVEKFVRVYKKVLAERPNTFRRFLRPWWRDRSRSATNEKG